MADVDRREAEKLLADVAAGSVSVADALDRLTFGVLDDTMTGYADLGFARVDTHRALRTGDPEVIYGAGKTPEQIVAIVRRLRQTGTQRPILVTRVSDSARSALLDTFADEVLDDPVARCVAVGQPPAPVGTVTVVSAGTSDLPVAAEAAFTVRTYGVAVEQIHDVGVAGLHRLLAVRPQLERADCVIVVAGMEGALASVVGGLIGVPLIAVPTSVGYGTGAGGVAALLTMLNSCAPGTAVVNIDNGFGAGVCAARIARAAAGATRFSASETTPAFTPDSQWPEQNS